MLCLTIAYDTFNHVYRKSELNIFYRKELIIEHERMNSLFFLKFYENSFLLKIGCI